MIYILKLLYQICVKYIVISYSINYYLNFNIKYYKNIINY
jgi:hypothetical protein